MIANDNRPMTDHRFLWCDATGNIDPSSFENTWVSNPVRCLDKAVEEHPELIGVRFGRTPIPDGETFVELVAALKRNRHTRNCVVLVLLHSRHRKLIEDLERAKADYVRYVGDIWLDSGRIREIVEGLGPDDRIERHAAAICPFLSYTEIDSRREMAVCGAYLDRLVPGNSRLHTICETGNHLQCEHYLNPRPKKS